MTEVSSEKRYRLSIRRPVTVAMLFLTLIVFGWKSYRGLTINLMPDISYPTLTVRTEYEGAAPEDVEELVTRPLEETLSTVGGLVEISSVSSADLSEVILEFAWDTDMKTAQQDVRDRLDLFRPPRDITEQPVILRYDPTLDPVLRIAITGKDLSEIADPERRRAYERQDLTRIRDTAERHVKSDLEAEVGIAQALIKGGREEEIQILVDAARLKSLGFSLAHVTDSLAQQNINLSGGRLKEGKTEYLVRTLNEFEDVEEIREAIVGTSGEDQIRLKDVARVILGQKDRETIVRINGREAVGIEIYKEGGANTVEVCNKVKDLFGFERPLTVTERLARSLPQFTSGAQKRMEEERRERELAHTLRSRLPDYARFTLVSDQSRFIVGSIKEVQRAMVYGGVLALIVLFVFLWELRSTAIIGISIPISVIATFVPMYLRDLSLNVMSLGGLALGVGMLVDNSIVVLESVFRCREEGDGLVDAAERGTREVGGAVTASTLTTVAVFFPIVFVEGIAGQIFGDLALTVTFSLVTSLVVALYLIPMLVSRRKLAFTAQRDVVWLLRAYRELRKEKGVGPVTALFSTPAWGARRMGQALKARMRYTFGPAVETIAGKRSPMRILRTVGAVLLLPVLALLFVVWLVLQSVATVVVTALFLVLVVVAGVLRLIGLAFRLILWPPLAAFDVAFRGCREMYGTVLRHALRFAPVLLLAVAGLTAHAAFEAVSLGRELIPPLKQGEFGIRMEAPPGTRLEETARRAQRIEALVLDYPAVESVTVEVGSDASAVQSDLGENVAKFTVLLRNAAEAAQYQDEIIEALRPRIAEVSPDQITFTLPMLFSFKTAVELQIRGEEIEELRVVGRRVLAAIEDVEGLKDAELSLREGYPEVIIEVDRDLLAAKGISPAQVAQRLRTEVQGDVATRFNRTGERIDIRVRTDRRRLQSLEDLRNVSVAEGDPPIPLASVARISTREGPSEIRRVDQRRVVLVTANVEGRDLGAVSRDIMDRLRRVRKPEDYYFILGGQQRELETSYRSLQFALILAVFLVYVVMACQFESFWQPALVMFSVPLGFIGVVYVLSWLEIDLSIVVFIGGIVLAGIIVNDAIVLIDYINQLRRRGMNKADAIVQAGKVRFRPILMTTITTVLGLTPMALWTGEGAEMRQPMAITVMAGLTSATVLTLLVIPMACYVFGGRDKA